MLIMGPISSLYDFLTFWVLFRFFHAGEVLFHTGWFIESLATQILVLFVIRTPTNPLTSRPSPLAVRRSRSGTSWRARASTDIACPSPHRSSRGEATGNAPSGCALEGTWQGVTKRWSRAYRS